MKNRASIRYKFLLVTTVLLAICVGAYLLLAVDVFKKDKISLVYDLNRSQVSNLVSELNIQFHSLSDKLEMFALSEQKSTDKIKESIILDLIERDSDIVYLSLRDPSTDQEIRSYINKKFLATYSLEKSFFTQQIAESKPIPTSQIMQNGEGLWNSTLKDGPPLIGYGRSVIQENGEGVPYGRLLVVAFIYPQRLMNSLAQAQLSDSFIFTGQGELLLSSQRGGELQTSHVNSQIISEAIASNEKIKVLKYEDNGKEMLAAYARGFRDQIFAFTQVDEEKAFNAVQRLVFRTILFALIVFTLAFLAAVIFSRSLTRPLEILMQGMGKVSEGDLDVNIAIRSKDEIASLANSFNAMIKDLKTSREQLIDINRDLEQKVKDRTKRLEEQNQAVKEAQEALLRTTRLAAAGEIAGRAAHEVLNPLTSIFTRIGKMQKKLNEDVKQGQELMTAIHQAWMDDMAKGGLPELIKHWQEPSEINKQMTLWDEDQENIKFISDRWREGNRALNEDCEFLLSEGTRINRIVQQMRSFNVVSGNRKEFVLTELSQECVKIMSDLFEQKKIKLVEDYAFVEIKIQVDRDEFIQSVTNLLRNSLQAILMSGRSDGVVKLVSFVRQGEVGLSIEDNGVGISEENQAKLFESQFSTKDPGEGTGLGLSISRRFIRAHGGDIRFVSSEAMKKTIFEIIFPLSETLSEKNN